MFPGEGLSLALCGTLELAPGQTPDVVTGVDPGSVMTRLVKSEVSVARTKVTVEPNWIGLLRLHMRVQAIHNSIVEDVYQDAWQGAAVDTGEMRATLHVKHVMSRMWTWSSRFVSRVVVGSDHWPFVEWSTSAHEIRAEPGGALFWPGAAHPVASVWHPGTRAQPFMRPAIYKQRSLRGRP